MIIFLFHEYASVTESGTLLFDKEPSHKRSVRPAKKNCERTCVRVILYSDVGDKQKFLVRNFNLKL